VYLLVNVVALAGKSGGQAPLVFTVKSVQDGSTAEDPILLVCRHLDSSVELTELNELSFVSFEELVTFGHCVVLHSVAQCYRYLQWSAPPSIQAQIFVCAINHHDTTAHEGVDVQLNTFLPSTWGRHECQVHTPGEGVSSIHYEPKWTPPTVWRLCRRIAS
jgi:hypothetical protein